MEEAKISAKLRRFADAYLETGDAARAAEKAGYSARYGPRALKLPEVAAYLDQRGEELRRERVASTDEVLEYLTGVLRGGGGQGAMKAAELLGKRFGLFSERGEELPAPVIVDDLSGPDGAD